MATLGKAKSFSSREFNRILIDNGFELVRKKGDHYIFKRGQDTVATTNGSAGMNSMVARRIIKTYNLEFWFSILIFLKLNKIKVYLNIDK